MLTKKESEKLTFKNIKEGLKDISDKESQIKYGFNMADGKVGSAIEDVELLGGDNNFDEGIEKKKDILGNAFYDYSLRFIEELKRGDEYQSEGDIRVSPEGRSIRDHAKILYEMLCYFEKNGKKFY